MYVFLVSKVQLVICSEFLCDLKKNIYNFIQYFNCNVSHLAHKSYLLPLQFFTL